MMKTINSKIMTIAAMAPELRGLDVFLSDVEASLIMPVERYIHLRNQTPEPFSEPLLNVSLEKPTDFKLIHASFRLNLSKDN